MGGTAQRRGHVKITNSNLRKARVQVFLGSSAARGPKCLDLGFLAQIPNKMDGGIWYAGLSLTNIGMTKLNDEVQCLSCLIASVH
jgi:hypothetical protein